ncbi:MAG: ribonuclease H-like domain-containing protein [Chitinophagaceae bacterium]|nr:ribonuclease H-like domain-containing protein [Chitinophagaceae bacterium]
MQQIPVENLLFIDIETVPSWPVFESLEPDWQMLWTEKVQRSLPENVTAAEFYEQRAGVMAEFAKVICISIGYCRKESGTLQLRIKSFYGDDEKSLLEQFISTLQQAEIGNNRWNFCGHNIKEFDIPFLCRRLIINGLFLPPYLDFQNMKPWETNIVDTFQYWRFGDYKNYTSLKLLAAALGVPSPKDDIDGSQVADVYWKEKNLPRIVTYCQKDVVTTANIVMRFKHLPVLGNDQVLIV